VESWIHDVLYAVRSLTAAKKFGAIVIATLALGIGANAAVFGVLNAVVLQPLPYDDPDRLVRMYQSFGPTDNYFTGAAIIEFRDASKTIDIAPLYTYSAESADLTDRPQPERVGVMPVSADYFRVLGVRPSVGTVFQRSDERRNAGVAVVSDRIWREYLGAAADAPGHVLSLNGVPTRVLGVLPAGFDDPLRPGVEVWVPTNLTPGGTNNWDNSYLSAIGRLRPGVTLQQAQAEMTTIATGQQSHYGRVPRWVRVATLQTDTVGSAGRTLWLLFGAVGVLLVIACVNVAGVMLARGAARESELAVRAALGCSRWRLTRQVVVESVLLSLVGGAVGLILARVVTRVLLAAAPETVTQMAASTHTAFVVVLAFGFVVTLVTGVACGLAPALQFARPDLEAVLRESGRGASGSRRQLQFRNLLVVCQVALALVLLIGAGLLLKTFQRLSSVNLGVRPANVITFQVNLPIGRYPDPERRASFHREFQKRVATIPGVRASAAISRLPVTGTYHSWGTRRAEMPDGTGRSAQQRVIEGAYFEALGIPLLRGRTFGPEDVPRTPRQVVVSQEVVRALFPSDDPLGKQLRVAGENVEIIGVVADVALTARGVRQPTVYHSHTQFAADRVWALTQVVTTDRPDTSLLADIRRELATIDPALVLYQPRMLTDVIGAGIAQERFALLVIGAYALLALALAAVGIYGVLSYGVSRRTRELGIRIALGAPIGSVRALVVRDGGRLAIVGVTLGLVVAYWATRTLGSLLFDVSATEPLVFGAAAATLVAVALAASWMPARTATRVDPLRALRGNG
jgi:putative ABC transport system permease protein